MNMAQEPVAAPLTYETYMAEGEVNRRYDILDGMRHYMTNPTRHHQDIVLNIAELLKAYARRSRAGKVYIAPCDVLIRRFPLRTRQPDVLFMSNERMGRNQPANDPAPLDPAPELVVEVISPSDSVGVLAGKLADYQKVGVQECWIVEPGRKSVELMEITEQGIDSVGVYLEGAELSSRAFPGLQVAVAEIFAE